MTQNISKTKKGFDDKYVDHQASLRILYKFSIKIIEILWSSFRLKFSFFQDDFSKKSSEMLFGKDCTVQKAFDLLDKDKNGEVG